MLDMEISIKWNVCRVCLAEEKPNSAPDVNKSSDGKGSVGDGGGGCGSGGSGSMRHIFSDTKLPRQIYDCSGVKVIPNDNLPDKICRHCLTLLKYAVNFSTTCRNSDEYLQSVIQKTKSATSLLKLDRRRERTMELVDEIFHEDEELHTAELAIDDDGRLKVEGTNEQDLLEVMCVKLSDEEEQEAEEVELEVIGDTVSDRRKRRVHSLKKALIGKRVSAAIENDTRTSSTLKGETIAERIEQVTVIDAGAIVERKSSNEELVELLLEDQEQDDVDENDMDENEIEENDTKKERFRKTTSECSIEDDGYMDDGEEEHGDALDFGTGEKNFHVETMKEGATDQGDKETVDVEQPVEEEEGAYFYVLNDIKRESVEIKQECDSLDMDHGNNVALDLHGGGDGDGDAEAIESIKSGCAAGNAAGEPFVEYLIDDNESEVCSQPELEVKNARSPRSSSVTIKVGGRRWSPHTRKKVGDAYMYICDVCGNQFTNRSLMNYHTRIHRNEKNYECELCFKRFTAACNLTAHMRIHTGERPFECKFCQRRFTDRSTHIKHERIHTNEKPFQCNVCGKSFSLSTTLRAHEKVHTGEKPYKCLPCNKSFTLPHQLKAHLNTNQHKCVALEKDLTHDSV